MKPLTIELVKGQKQKFTFLGWKDDSLAFYATGMDGGQPTVITSVSAYPDNCITGEPYRFPRIVALEIIPKQFDIAWTDHHRDVLRRWRDAKFAEVDTASLEELFPWDAVKTPRPLRSPEEIKWRRQREKDGWERHYKTLVETPLVDLLDPISYAGVLAISGAANGTMRWVKIFRACWVKPRYSRIAGNVPLIAAVWHNTDNSYPICAECGF